MTIAGRILVVRLNDLYVTVSGLQDGVTSVYYNDTASVVATLYDQFGNPVPGFSGVQMAYVAETNGNYRGLIDQTFDPPLGGGYRLEVTALVPGGQDPSGFTKGFWKIPVVVQDRTQ